MKGSLGGFARVDLVRIRRARANWEVGLSDPASERGPLECTMVHSSGLASGRVSSSEPEGWLELTSFCKGFV